MSRIYVAVDLDGTLSTANVSFAFGRFLYSQGRISCFRSIISALVYLVHCFHLLSIKAVHRSIFRILFVGVSRDSMERDVAVFVRDYWDSLIRHSVCDEIARYIREGAHVALLSSSPDFLVAQVASRLNISTYMATEYVVDEKGLFRRIGIIVTGCEKAQFVREVKKNADIEVVAITDSTLDRPLLEEATVVIVVDPDYLLAREAKKRGWKIIAR